MARAQSDEGSASQTGGKLPFFDATSSIDAAFAAAIFADGLKPGDLIPPFKSSFGWHVVQFMRPYGEGPAAWLERSGRRRSTVPTSPSSHRTRARATRRPTAATSAGSPRASSTTPSGGGDLRHPVGQVDRRHRGARRRRLPLQGVAEETRPPTKEQIAIFKDSGFTNWYAEKKAEVEITRSAGTATTTE